MPLPLYGSGLRILRMSAATWPTSCLSAPATVMRVGAGDVEGDAFGGVDHDRVREAELELELRRTLRDAAVADAHDLEVAGEALATRR